MMAWTRTESTGTPWPLRALAPWRAAPATEWLRCGFCRAVLPDPVVDVTHYEVGPLVVCFECTNKGKEARL